MAIKELSLVEVEEQGDRAPIWALNNSAKSDDVGVPGDLLISVPRPNSPTPDLVRVEQTFLAIELTGQVPRKNLLDSSEFRKAVTNRRLILVSPEQAAKINNREGSDVERRRLAEIRNFVRTAGAARTISDANVSITSTSDDYSDDDDAAANEINAADVGNLEKTSEGFDQAFTMWVTRLQEKSDVECKNDILGRRNLKRKEVKYLVKSLADKPKTIAWLKSRLAR